MFEITNKLSGIDPGIYPELSNHAYHTGPGLSKSNLDQIHRSPAHFLAAFEIHEEPTEALLMGTAFHTAVLEPERFEREYVVSPVFNRRTKDGKAAAEAWSLENAHKTPISAEDMMIVRKMRESVMSNPISRKLIESTQHEISIYADMDGVLTKCRPDGWNASEGVLIDLKSAKDASADGFRKAVANGRYHVQDAWYRTVIEELTGERQEAFYFIACEKEPPFAMAIYQLDPITFDVGYRAAMNDLETFRRAVETGKWDAYPRQIQSLSLPRWALGA